MNTRSLLPPPAISDYVKGILVIENYTYTDGFILPLYANGSPTIVFQTAMASKRDRTVDHLTLYGQTIAPDGLDFDGGFTLIAYFLHPHTLASLFDISAGELTDECIDLNDLKRARAMHLREQLLHEPSLQVRLQLIDDFILKLSALSNDQYDTIFFLANKLRKVNGFHTLTEIRDELDITERSLQRLFEEHVGVSPRMYKRICQFHAAFQQLNNHRFSKLSDIAYQYGFSDQSHFTRVFKEFTGLTPTGYLNLGKKL